MNGRMVSVFILVLLLPLASRGFGSARAQTGTPGTPTPTTPTPTPAQTPPILTILARSERAMRKVHQLHSDGVVADSPSLIDKGVRLTADCDVAAGKVRIRLDQGASGSEQFVEFVIFKHADWYRTSDDPTWQLDTQANVDVLILFLAPACPMLALNGSSGGQLTGTPKAYQVRRRNLGSVMVDGVPAWRMRLVYTQKKQRATIDYYVDQSRYRWRRVVGNESGYYSDMHYSNFNQAVVIPRPVVGTTP